MRALLSARPLLWFLFPFNLVLSVAAGFALHGTQQLLTSTGMGVVSLGAGISLFLPGPKRGLTGLPSPPDPPHQRPSAQPESERSP